MKEKNGSISAAIFCTGAIISKYLVVIPKYMVKASGNAAWIEMVFVGIFAVLGLAVLIRMYKPFCALSYEDVLKVSLGPFLGEAVKYLYALGFIILNAGILRILLEALRSVMANDAPIEYFAMFVAVSVCIAAYHGTEAVSNIAIVVFPIIVISIVTVIFILSAEFRIDNIMPIFGSGIKEVFKASLTKHFGFAELVLIFFIAPRLAGYNELKKAGALTAFFSTVFSIGLILAYCLTVPYPASEKFVLPLYQMSRMIRTGTFLQRLEPLVVFIWTGLIMCGLAIVLCMCSRLLSKSEKRNPAIWAVGLITLFLALLPTSDSLCCKLYEKTLMISPLLYPIIPFFVLLIANIRKGKGAAQ